VTIENLEREGYGGWAGLALKPAGSTLTTVAYKSGARAAIEQQGYRIVANIGDQYSDLQGGYADNAQKLPNPTYYLPSADLSTTNCTSVEELSRHLTWTAPPPRAVAEVIWGAVGGGVPARVEAVAVLL